MEHVKSDDLLIVQCQNSEKAEVISAIQEALVAMKAEGVVVLPKNISLIAVPRDIQVVCQI